MSFYSLSKQDRIKRVLKLSAEILQDIKRGRQTNIVRYFADEDTYIRKNAYIATGRIYFSHENLCRSIMKILDRLSEHSNPKIRQTVVNSAGEIAMKDFSVAEHFFDRGLFDVHHSVRNAVIGSMKKAGEKNPKPVLSFAKKYLAHPDKEIRREICHGIELRGRTHPQDILPLLKKLQHDKTSRVRNTLVHVLGQIAYKKGCLETVVADLQKWENKDLVHDALEEIIDVHHRYRNFSARTQQQAKEYIDSHFDWK